MVYFDILYVSYVVYFDILYVLYEWSLHSW
jgi:hypothetical protein